MMDNNISELRNSFYNFNKQFLPFNKARITCWNCYKFSLKENSIKYPENENGQYFCGIECLNIHNESSNV
jgi:hypothetical protein